LQKDLLAVAVYPKEICIRSGGKPWWNWGKEEGLYYGLPLNRVAPERDWKRQTVFNAAAVSI